MSEFIPPALLQSAKGVPTAPGWIFELKLDGARGQISIDRLGQVEVRTRTGVDWTARFPAIVAEVQKLSLPRCILDGEIVARNDNGRTDFRLFSQRLHHGAVTEFVCFDLIALGSGWVTDAPLEGRRRLLQEIFQSRRSSQVSVSPVHANGDALMAHAKLTGEEGIVCKRLGSRYEFGLRSTNWLKLKVTQREDLFVVGWSGGSDGRLRSIAVASETSDGLRFRGWIGSGFNTDDRTRLPAALRRLERDTPIVSPPARSPCTAHWLNPSLKAEVRFDAITREGLLRGATFLGMRPDLLASLATKRV